MLIQLWCFRIISRLLQRVLIVLNRCSGLGLKLSQSVEYRQKFQNYYRSDLELKSTSRSRIWIHGASVGELEDIAAFFRSESQLQLAELQPLDLVITSSSPSALHYLNSLKGYHYTGPIPPESVELINDWLDRMNIRVLLLSHHDVWPELFYQACYTRKVKIIWIPERSPSSDRLLRAFLIPHLVIVCEKFQSTDLNHIKLLSSQAEWKWIGSPRVDRIFDRLDEESFSHPSLERPNSTNVQQIRCLLGSAWPEDSLIFSRALAQLTTFERERIELHVIPHEIDDRHTVASIRHHLPNSKIHLLKGVLLHAYRHFDIAYVGGGFRTGLHSVLEPAISKVPTLCGPNLAKQSSAPSLIRTGSLRRVETHLELVELLRLSLAKGEAWNQWRLAAERSGVDLESHRHASKRLASVVRSITKSL